MNGTGWTIVLLFLLVAVLGVIVWILLKVHGENHDNAGFRDLLRRIDSSDREVSRQAQDEWHAIIYSTNIDHSPGPTPPEGDDNYVERQRSLFRRDR